VEFLRALRPWTFLEDSNTTWVMDGAQGQHGSLTVAASTGRGAEQSTSTSGQWMAMPRQCEKTLLLTEDTTRDKDARVVYVDDDKVEHVTVRRGQVSVMARSV
jgi:hypothetical protein